jgi:hypothetical protein
MPLRPNVRAQTGRFVLTACALAGSAVAPARADDWPTYQHDPAHTGHSTASPDPASLALRWRAPIGYSTPLIVGQNVIATHNGQGTNTPTTVTSFQLNTGTVNWSYSDTYTFPSQAAVGNGLVAITDGGPGTNPYSLVVLDAQTGTFKYKVNIGFTAQMPLLVPETNGTTTAYVANGGNLKAVSLGATSGSVLWSATGNYGGFSIPTLVGSNTLVLAGPAQYYAVNRATGVQNHFQNGPLSGGGGDTVAYDAGRSAFYVLDAYDSTTPTLTAYSYGGAYNAVTRLWGITGTGIADGGQVAIGPNGRLYAVDSTTLVEIDPATGTRLRTKTGQTFATAVAPLIAGNTLWAYDNNNHTFAYDLTTLSLVRTLTGSRGSLNSAFDGPGAVDDSHYLIDYGNIYNSPGFDVYAVPEPASLLAVAAVVPLLSRRRRRTVQG